MPEAKRKSGRPKIVWSEKEYGILQGLCSIQATLEEIEDVLDIDRKTLYRLCKVHYKDPKGKPMDFSTVYKKYSATGKTSLRRWQFRSAENGNVSMQIWLGKQYLGQTDKQEIAQDDNSPITINVQAATVEDARDE